MTEQEIIQGVKECVAYVVEGDADDIREDQSIIADLGADSLDLLELVFQLQQRFDIIITPRGIEKRAQEELGDTPMTIDGVYTPEALVELRKNLPEIPEQELAEGLHMADLPRRFRVATMVNLVKRMMEEQGEQDSIGDGRERGAGERDRATLAERRA